MKMKMTTELGFISAEQEAELRAALARIKQGKTPPPMHDPYTGKPMTRAERRQMQKAVTRRLNRKEKEDR